MTDDLAPGFQSVDRASEFALFSGCLDLIDSLPFFAERKRESYNLLGAAPGRRILEVGCRTRGRPRPLRSGSDPWTPCLRVSRGGEVHANVNPTDVINGRKHPWI